MSAVKRGALALTFFLYLIGDIEGLGGINGPWMSAFITGFYQGSSWKCPMMTGRILQSHLGAVIQSGRATPEMDMRTVLHQLLREAGCTIPVTNASKGDA